MSEEQNTGTVLNSTSDRENASTADVLIKIEADPTLSYASIHNSVPVVRALEITNQSGEPLHHVHVLVSCNPPFARGAKLHLDQLAPGETRRISPIDLSPDHAYLADLQESLRATVQALVQLDGRELTQYACEVEVLAYNQWAGTRALPELLAAFSMPNNPAVDRLLGKASTLLRSQHSDLSLNGYQARSRDVVWKQVSAIYSTLAAENFQYAEPPASFANDGQKIRTPDRVIEGRVATCLDLTMLFASCLEQAGLRPIVLLNEGHAWAGVWLHATSFPSPLTDEAQAVRKRVTSGELLVFETTGIAQHSRYRSSLRHAMEQGQEHLLDAKSFRYALDIYQARSVQIRPLPSRVGPLEPIAQDAGEQPLAIEAMPALPPIDPEVLAAVDLPRQEAATGRLAVWKAKLLDLSLRNRLLNFKPSKTTLHLVAPDLARLEDALADGVEFRIKPVPSMMEGADPRMAQVHANRNGRTALHDVALEALANKELLVNLPPATLDANVLAISTAARTGLEEGGANTLYLAIGMLSWKDTEKAETAHLAPLLLLPVTLERSSVRSGFRLKRHDDEAMINPTLLELLRSSFALRINGLDVIPTDDKGVDVVKILQTFRLAVREIAHWEVVDEAYLGIFSFTKYLMWKDLQDRTEQLTANSLVRHLIENPGQALAPEGHNDEWERLDETYRPQDLLAPLLADSSQLKALCAVDSGRNLVLEGPPGTGKSQTITNLIAHTLAKGKTVLFVSEKMAALNVVHSRLTNIGLGNFCLELHSAKAKKTEVLQQLGRSIETSAQRTVEDWNREAERLARLRHDLNGLVTVLHQRHPNGLSVHEALGTCVQHTGQQPSPLRWPDPLAHDRAALDRLRQEVARLASIARSLGPLQEHPLRHVGRTDWTSSWQDEFLDTVKTTQHAVETLKKSATDLDAILGQPTAGWSLDGYEALDGLADVLLAAPPVQARQATQAHESHLQEQILSFKARAIVRSEHWIQLGDSWAEGLATLPTSELREAWQQAASAWWPKSIFAKRAVTSRLLPFRVDGKRPTGQQVQALWGPLASVNEDDAVLRELQKDIQALLHDAQQRLQVDRANVTEQEKWAERLATRVAHIATVAGVQPWPSLGPWVSKNRALLAPVASAGCLLLAYRNAWRDVRQAVNTLTNFGQPTEPLVGSSDANGMLERVQATLSNWLQAQRSLQPWCLWRSARQQCLTQGLEGVVHSLETGNVSPEHLEAHFEFSYRSWWVKKLIDREPTLRSFSSADHERKINEFREADKRFEKLTEQYIVATLAGRVPVASGAKASNESEMGCLQRELQKQRKHLPVRQLVQRLPTLLPKLKPCLLMSPLSVAQYLDARHTPFDLVVFDEASQIPVWDAIGAIARGKKLVVVGDPKQLPPTNFFNKGSGSEGGGSDDEPVEDLESILDECLGVGMQRMSLQWHYRSRHESLITFSNVKYYESNLVTFPSPVTDDRGVRFEHVRGTYDRGGSHTNRSEADAIVAAIENHYLASDKQALSLGVVTFNQAQQELIETLLDARRRANAKLDQAIASPSREALFVKNLENVQGDERDVIFFSITYGPDAAGKITMNFGPLNRDGGQRRLNVAISRAREAVIIFSTLLPEQIDPARVRAAGARDLKTYLEFAQRGPRALIEQRALTGLDPDSPFEVAVANALREKNWTVHYQVGCSGYRIDLGIVDPAAPGRYLLGVECDGRTYHSGATARDRDRLRQHVLEALGWNLHRIWSTDWWLNPEREIEKIARRIQTLLEARGSNEAEAAPQDDDAIETLAATASSAEVVCSPGSLPASSAQPSERTPPNESLTLKIHPIYTPVELPAGNPSMFYEPITSSMLAGHLCQVTEGEGPLPEAVLFRRISRAWGLERAGARVVKRLRDLMPATTPRTLEGDVTFYWPVGRDPQGWKRFRVANHMITSQRAIRDVCQEEIAALVLHLLHHDGSTPRRDVAKAVCRLVGMNRTTAEAEARVSYVISLLQASGELAEQDGCLRETASSRFQTGLRVA